MLPCPLAAEGHVDGPSRPLSGRSPPSGTTPARSGEPATGTTATRQPVLALSHAAAMETVTLSQAAVLQPRAPGYHASGGPAGTAGVWSWGGGSWGCRRDVLPRREGTEQRLRGHSTGRRTGTDGPPHRLLLSPPRHEPLIGTNAGKTETGPKPADWPQVLEQVSSPWDQLEAPGRFHPVWDAVGASPTLAVQVWQPTSICGCCSLLRPRPRASVREMHGGEIPIDVDKDGGGKVTVQTAKGSWGDAKLWQAVEHPSGLCRQRARRDSGVHPSPVLSHSPAASWAGAGAGPKLFVVPIKRQAKDAQALLAWLCAGDTESCEMITTEIVCCGITA